jgi:hypothetical protein
MPSRKVEAAAVGKRATRTSQPKGRTAARFGTVPSDPERAREQEDRRAESDQALQGTPWKNGVLLDVEFSGGAGGLTQVIAHNLGGKAQGIVICDMQALVPLTTIVHEPATDNPDSQYARTDTHIKLNATSACKAKVWIWR